jgi:hypothetical protein
MEEFSTENELEAHERNLETCDLKVKFEDPSRGFNKIQESQLKSRKRRADQTEEEKWKHIYLILFSGEEMSIPYPCKYAR